MEIKSKIKSGILLVIITIGLFPSSVNAVDVDFGNDIYQGDYLFDFMNQSDDDSDDDFGSGDIDFNSGSEEPQEDFSALFGDLLGEIEDSSDTDIDNDFGSDDIDFNAPGEEDIESIFGEFEEIDYEIDSDFSDIFGDLLSEVDEIEDDSDAEQDFSNIFGDLLSEVEEEEIEENSELEEDFSDIFENLLGDVEEEEANTNVVQQQYPNCKAIDDMLYGYNDLHVSKFIDIDESLYKNDIIRVENAGVIDGRSANTFDPYEPITRAEFLSVAMKAHCIDFSAEGTHDFIDVESSGWKARVISKAISEEIISGSTNAAGQKIFRPNDPITRMEVLAILLNMTKKEIPWDRESPYIDIASQQWQKNYVTRWNELGLFMPYKTHNQFYPNRYVMREHIGSILYRVVQLYR